MKFKRKRVVEVPSKIKAFINNVKDTSLENIEEPLKSFSWEFDKGDFHHWVELFNHFDSYFEKWIKPRKDLKFEDNFVKADPPFPRNSVLEILRVLRIILENCSNKHFYSSYEHHLSSLLSCTDADVVEASLQTLAAFLKKTVGKCSIRDASLTSKLSAFSQGWGSKEFGLGLITCSTQNGCAPISTEVGSTLHFEFYADSDTSMQSCSAGTSNTGLKVIHLPNINSYTENDLELLSKLVEEYKVPSRLCFSLLTRLRFTRVFCSLPARQQYVCIRLYAFIVLAQASNDAENLSVFFNNEPEFVNELVSLLNYEDLIPEKIQILGILSLAALCHDRSHQPTVLDAVSSGGNRGILPGLMQRAIVSITTESGKWSTGFAEALLSLVTVLVSSSPGSSALREAGFIPTLLPLLKDTKSQHIHLVSTAVHVLEAFMDYSNPAVTLFRELGGLDDTIARLKLEVSYVENGLKKNGENSQDTLCDRKGKQVIDSFHDEASLPYFSENMVSYHRKVLMKVLLRAISLATYAPGSTARIYGSEENLLPQCLCIIFRRAKDFGGGVFSLAATVMSDLIHKDPTCFSILDAADLPRAFLDSIMCGVLCSAEAITCIPQCLDALCLNNSGLLAVKDCNALSCFVKIFTSRTYLRALSGDTPASLSSGLDELIRHASSLRGSAVENLIDILQTISKFGTGAEAAASTECQFTSTLIPMETDLEERDAVILEDTENSKTECSEQVEGSSDISAVHIEYLLPEYVSNATRLLETVLQNGDTCRLFIERKGIEAVLQLFNLPLMPLITSIGQNVSVAFKNFSPLHSITIARAVCSFLKEHLKSLNESLALVGGSKLIVLTKPMQMKVTRSLSTLEGILSLSNILLKTTSTMVSEIGSSDADIVKDLGKAYKEILWQISLSNDSKVEEKQNTKQDTGTGDGQISNNTGIESDDDTNSAPVRRYTNPFHVRNGPTSRWRPWSIGHEFIPAVGSTENLHRHGRYGFSRTRGGRNSRHIDIAHIDSESSTNMLETSPTQDVKKKNPDVIILELLNKLVFTSRAFHVSLVKGLTPRRRSDHGSLSPACKNIATALAKLFLEALCYSGQATQVLDMSLSVKCRYLGNVVDDMISLIFDSRKRSCNTALVNSFYVNGAFKELLTTFKASSQLLWTLPCSLPTTELDKGNVAGAARLFHNSWLLDTLQNYCRLLEYFVNSSLLLSPNSTSMAQLLVQPVASGLSLGLFAVPRDPELFVQMLQSQVLDVILPIWNHPMFYSCSSALISSVVSIVTHIYSGAGYSRNGRIGTAGSAGHRLTVPPLDESSIISIVEMGFTRARAEEALRSVGTDSVEMAMDWLFGHPEEYAQEDVQLTQALELSLGSSSEIPKDNSHDKIKDTFIEGKRIDVPPVDDILSTSINLFQNGFAINFPLTDLLVTLCNRNNGEDRQRVVLFFIQKLKITPSDPLNDMGALSHTSHILALLLSEETSTRAIAAENGVVTVALDVLTYFTSNDIKDDISVTKCLSALFLILNDMVQPMTKYSTQNIQGTQSETLSNLPGDNISVSVQASIPDDKNAPKVEKDPSNVFEKILGRSTGYLTLEVSQRALLIACEFIKMHAPAMVMQAVLQLCARLTKTHVLAVQFLGNEGLAALFSLPKRCFFPGFDSLASAIIRHLLEDPQTLQTAMELEIRQTLTGNLSRHASRLSPSYFLTSMAPMILRDPATFMKAAAAVCQLDSSGGRMNIVLSREKEKEKSRALSFEAALPSSDCIRIPESRSSDTPSKCSRIHKKVPANLSQVMDQLLEIVMSYSSLAKHEENVNFSTNMDVDQPAAKEKGKSKVDETKVDISEKSASFAKTAFVLKMLSDILFMYVHAVGVILRRDADICQLRGLDQADEPTHTGVVCYVLRHLLPLSSDKGSEISDDWKGQLAEKASWFLVVLCGRSSEGRRRVISELVKAFSSFSNLESNSFTCSIVPNKDVIAFSDLVYSILSKNSSSSNLPGSGCSPDIAKAMIDGGIMQSLTNTLQVIDLDHPDAPKVVNLILKSLEILTRAANVNDQLYKSDVSNKKKPSGLTGRSEYSTNNIPAREVEHDQTVASENVADAVHTGELQVQRSSQDPEHQEDTANQPMQQDTRDGREDNFTTGLQVVHDVEFMHEGIDEQDILNNGDGVSMSLRVDHHTDDDMADEDDDMGEDAEDEDEDDDDDEDIAEEGAALMSLGDTDAEDRADDYNDEMIDDDDDDFPENRVIEVRWREGLTGLNQFRLLRGSADASRFADIAAEPFEGVNADDLFHFRRPLGVERRRNNGRGFLDRSFPESGVFQHPLLTRPSQSGESSLSSWPSAGNVNRDLAAISAEGFEPGFPSDYSGATLFGDRLVGAVPPPLIEFPLGIDQLHVGGRRGPSDGRWSNDGQPQPPSGQAAVIAQAVEDQFICQLRHMNPDDGSPAQRQLDVDQENHQENIPQSVMAHPLVDVDNNASQQSVSQHQEMRLVSDHQQGNLENEVDPLLPSVSHGIIDIESAAAIAEDISRAPNSTSPVLRESMHIGEGDASTCGLDTISGFDTTFYFPNVNLQIQEGSQLNADLQNSEHHNRCSDGPLGTDSHSSSHAVIDSGTTMTELSDGHAVPFHASADVDMSGRDAIVNQAGSILDREDETFGRQLNTEVPQELNQVDPTNINNTTSTSNSIDPTFLEALPENLRAEVLASQQTSQQVQSVPDATHAPPPEEIDPEFLAALPPDIQAEVLAQQRAQRFLHSQQAEGPVDMDNASILATFPPDLREEVLLTSPDTVLSSLPSNFLAEAQILRDRTASHYHTRNNLFGGSHRLGARRLAVDRQVVMDRGVGGTIGRRVISAIESNLAVKEVEGNALMDANALRALVRLLRLAQPLGKGLLQRLMLNLCAHTATRAILVRLLLDMINLEAEEFVTISSRTSYRLFGSQWNVLCGLSQPSNGLPPLVSRRILEILTYLATNHFSVSNLLFYSDPSLALEYPNPTLLDQKVNKGKEKISDAMVTPNLLESSWKERRPFLLFLKLLNKPLFLLSSVHLEQAMCLLQVVVDNAVSNLHHQSPSFPSAGISESHHDNVSLTGVSSESQNNILDQREEMTTNPYGEPCPGGKKTVNPFDIILELPQCDLHNLCSLLAHEGLSEKVYSIAAEVVKKLAFAATPHQKFFSEELANLAKALSGSAVNDLIKLKNTEMLGLSSGSMAGAAILRVLQTLSTLTSASDESKTQDALSEQKNQSMLWNLNTTLEPLWQELSDCISATETVLGQNSTLSSLLPRTGGEDLIGASSSLSQPLPPGTQKLLPYIEAFFVLCEKLQISQSVMQSDVNATASEVKEFGGGSSSPSANYGGIGTMTFARVVEKHRRLLNAFIRQNSGLLEKSLSMLLKFPRLIDFDNKRAYFRSRIRQRHDQHPSAPLRISVRRAYVLEDSYNQLRMRPKQDLKGRLTVQFQGEEGIDAGGLTREWYQLLSRVIFDKGALLFTTVGNNATFQPNPNSVYQTEHLSYFKFIGRVVAKALFDGQLLDVYFTRSFYKHILGVKVTYHDIEAVDPDYYKNLKWMLENDVSDVPDLTFSMDADEEKHILYEKTEVTDYELKPGGRNIRVTEDTKHEYIDLVAEHILSTAIRPQINSFLEGFNELIPGELISIFNDKELELLISGLPEIDFDDLKTNTEYTGYTAASSVVQWFWDVVGAFSKEDMARFLQFVTGTSKVPLEGFSALQGISGPQRFQIHKAYGAPERLPSAHTCFNQLDLPEYTSKTQLEERLLLAIHEASEGFGFG